MLGYSWLRWDAVHCPSARLQSKEAHRSQSVDNTMSGDESRNKIRLDIRLENQALSVFGGLLDGLSRKVSEKVMSEVRSKQINPPLISRSAI